MQYTVFHFGGEEKLMQEDKYPSLPSTKLRMTLLWKRSRGCIRS